MIGPSLRAAGEWALRFDTFLHVRIGPESEEDLYLCVGHIAFDDQNAPLLTGEWRTETARLAAQSPIWQRGPVTCRLEGAFTLEDALKIAATGS
ncbi:hypothetical protein ILP97_37800 [Amycolatopsis sp. H6(2020)]|nr:hypothetical protein [Amycolatopsis sp. H6(2020)]